jgi:monoamine oxidase
VTIPLGILKQDTIRFNPVLPVWKRTAISSLGVGLINKIILRFPSIFWSHGGFHFAAVNDSIDEALTFVNLVDQTGGQAMLMVECGGSTATYLESLTDDAAIVEHIMTVLRRMYHGRVGGVPEPVFYHVTR